MMSHQLKNYGTQCTIPLHTIDGNVSPIDISMELDGDFLNEWNLKVGVGLLRAKCIIIGKLFKGLNGFP
jgi:hypothetical protein